MAYTQSHVPMHCVQPNAAGFYDPNQQQLCVMQQMQKLHRGCLSTIKYCNQISQEES